MKKVPHLKKSPESSETHHLSAKSQHKGETHCATARAKIRAKTKLKPRSQGKLETQQGSAPKKPRR